MASDVFREAVDLSMIIDNLLLMTRIDRGQQLEMEPVVLRHICNRVLHEMPEDEAYRCRASYPGEVAIVLANPTSIEQVMRNLISNALKYSPSTELVDISIESGGREVVISVADRGHGVLASDRDRVFEPFFRAESTATRSGMGIGLTVCKRLVEAMEGKIWAEARADGGSVFSFSLPTLQSSDT